MASIVIAGVQNVLEKNASQTVENVLQRIATNHGLVPAVIKYVQITARIKNAREPVGRVTGVLQATLVTTAIKVSIIIRSNVKVRYVKGPQQTP